MQGLQWVDSQESHPAKLGSGSSHKAVIYQVENPAPLLIHNRPQAAHRG
jgi:hypothetical protein